MEKTKELSNDIDKLCKEAFDSNEDESDEENSY